MNARQQRFVEEYLVDPNAAGAARRAGYSKKTADRIGSRLLRNVEVAAAVRRAQDDRAQRTKVDADRVVEELALVAFGRMGDLFDRDTGRMLEVHEMSPEVQARLSSIKFTRERTHRITDGTDKTTIDESVVELKQWDKLMAIDKLCRIQGLYRDKLAHSGEVSLLDALHRIEKREDEEKAAAE